MKKTPSTALSMRQFFATAHALLSQMNVGYGDKTIGKQEAMDLFEPIEQMIRHAGQFDPMESVGDQGLPFMQELLRSDRVVPLSWLKGWVERNGLESVFEGAPSGHDIVTYWMDSRLLPSIEPSRGKYGATGLKKEIDVACWLVANATSWDSVAAAAWKETMAAANPEVASQIAPVLEGMEKRGVQGRDPARVPDRWFTHPQVQAKREALSSDDEFEALMATEVECLSGCRRPLGQLLALRNSSHRSDLDPDLSVYLPGQLSESALPELPHKRRADLARHWILAPGISTDVARARLWSATREKPEVVDELADLVRKKPDLADRIDTIVASRDKQGRSFSAFLRMSKMDYMVSGLRYRDWGGGDADLPSSSGAGLIEQALPSLLGLAPYQSASRWPDGQPMDALALGPSSRQGQWVDLAIDCLAFPASTHGSGSLKVFRSAAGHLDDTNDRLRLKQALWLNDFMCAAQIKPYSGNYPDAKETKGLRARFDQYLSSLRELADHLKANSLALNLGGQEWRQWKASIGLDAIVKSPPSWMEPAHKKVISGLVELMDMRSLERELERTKLPASNTSARRGPRL